MTRDASPVRAPDSLRTRVARAAAVPIVAACLAVGLGTAAVAAGATADRTPESPLGVLDFYVGRIVPVDRGDREWSSEVVLERGVGGRVIRFTGSWDRERFPPEFVDGLMAWDPVAEVIRISAVFYHGAWFSGVVRILDAERAIVQRDWTGAYPDGRRVRFRETWTPVSENELEWRIERSVDGEWRLDLPPGMTEAPIHRVVRETSTAPSSTRDRLALMERTAGHRQLDFLVGEWVHEEVQEILGEERTVSSVSSYEWLPGEVWLHGRAEIRGLPGIDVHHGWLHMTYDEGADEVVQLWHDNQSAILFVSRGRWEDGSRLVLEGTHEWGGTTRYRRVVYTVVGEDEFTREFLVSEDGGESYARRSLSTYRRR